MSRPIPEWFTIAEASNAQVMKRIAASVSSNDMSWQVRSAGMLAHWFVMDSLLLANQANRDGMHANALSLTRQCIEAIGIIELTIWPAAGLVDTEIGCFHLSEVHNAKKEVQPRVQA